MRRNICLETGWVLKLFTIEDRDYCSASQSPLLATSQCFIYTRSLVTESRTR
jgi:hypothetical protein